MGHRVAPDPLVDLLALDHPAAGLGEHLHELELAPGELEAVPGDEGLELVGADLDLAGDQRPASSRGWLRRRRRTTASIRAMTSSGCEGLTIQSSAPSRRPRTRWATVEPCVQTTTPRSGSIPQTRSRNSQPSGPSSARSTSDRV